MELENINRNLARRIIEAVGGPGEPPTCGFQFFTAGLDDYLAPLENEYLSSYIREGGGSFKMVVGTYGGGKTHFLYCIRELAWEHKFAVSYVTLNPDNTPFYKLELVFKSIIANLTYPMSLEEMQSSYEQGIENFTKKWFENKKIELKSKGIRGYRLQEELQRYASSIPILESTNFTNAIREAFLSLAENRNMDFLNITQWLKVEGYDRNIHQKYGVLSKIEKSNAFQMIRSLIAWIKAIGYSGLVVLLDEAEQSPSIEGKQKLLLLSNLRELIDECLKEGLANSMFFYAVPDEDFYKGGGQVYQALTQRLASVFKKENWVGVTVHLESPSNDPVSVLCEIGQKLAEIFQIYYRIEFPKNVLKKSILNISNAACEERFAEIGYKRRYVQSLIRGLQRLRDNPSSVISPEMAGELLHK